MKKAKFPKKPQWLEETDSNGKKYGKLILSSDFSLKLEDLYREKNHMSDEELYYIAISVSDMQSVKHKRAVFDMLHLQCDEDSVQRFMEYFSEKDKEVIMFSC